jgi:hypothetical protein
MIALKKAETRGRTDLGWLDSRHTFSFGEYYDPAAMGFSVLRVINEDRVTPGCGFPTHGHRDMEILSYVLEGALEHKDSLGTGSIIRPGEVQRMTAGTGVRHSEKNASPVEPVHFLQIWILPVRAALAPGYEQKAFPESERRGRLRLVASFDGRESSVVPNDPSSCSSAARATWSGASSSRPCSICTGRGGCPSNSRFSPWTVCPFATRICANASLAGSTVRAKQEGEEGGLERLRPARDLSAGGLSRPGDLFELGDDLRAHGHGVEGKGGTHLPPGNPACDGWGHSQAAGRCGANRNRARDRIVVEKPLGHDLDSAREMNRTLRQSFDESQIFRIDHYLGKETVQNILAFRFANPLFEPIWNRRYVDYVTITVAEEVGVGHRGGYYEHAGALRDMVQNHLMQLLCLVAMEPMVSFDADEIRNKKVDVLHALRPIARARDRGIRGSRAVRSGQGPGQVDARLPSGGDGVPSVQNGDLRGR